MYRKAFVKWWVIYPVYPFPLKHFCLSLLFSYLFFYNANCARIPIVVFKLTGISLALYYMSI